MKLEEYKKWIKQNANQEEVMAYEVARRIIKYHTMYHDDCEVSCFPRKILTHGKNRLEFDLVIKIEWETNKRYERLIGVEFKEYDMDKVIMQAIARRFFVDYMYIATRNVVATPYDIFRLTDFGIGWVVWEERFVKMLFPAKFERFGGVYDMLQYLAKKAVEEVIEKKKKEYKLSKFMSLFDYVEV